MKKAALRYSVVFGKGDASDWIDYEIKLTDEEAAVYDNAIANGIPLEDVNELQGALDRGYEEIEDMEIANGIDYEDEYVLECQGKLEMDTLELNELVHNRNPHAINFFGLEEASDEEIKEWDADDLDDIPLIKDFQEDFEPYSPYDEGWTLNVEFVDPNN